MKPGSKPCISVVIPVRNGEAFLRESINSVLRQICSFKFEVIVVNDGSTDDTSLICQEFSDSSFSFLESPGHGISDALNFGILHSQSDYIARHDSDDIMLPGRLQIQHDFLDQNPDFVVVGGQIELFGLNNIDFSPNIYPTGWEDMEHSLARGCFIAHPTAIFLKDAFTKVGGYRKHFDGAEDYDLWLRMSRVGKIGNMDTPVTKYRIHPNQVTSKNWLRTNLRTAKVRISWICRFSIPIKQRGTRNRMRISKIAMMKYLIIEVFNFIKHTSKINLFK